MGMVFCFCFFKAEQQIIQHLAELYKILFLQMHLEQQDTLIIELGSEGWAVARFNFAEMLGRNIDLI